MNVQVKTDIVMWPIERCIPYARNPRKNDHVVDQMAGVIREFGFKIPILAKSDGTVVDGHLRLKAAEVLKMALVPVILCDEWTDAQVKAFRLLVNRSATWADWDEELLALELHDLQDANFDLTLTGFSDEELKGFLEPEDLDISAEVEKNEQAELLLNEVWAAWRKDVLEALQLLKPIKAVTVGMSRNATKIRFINALYYKKSLPRSITFPYTPHRLSVGTEWGSLLNLLEGRALNGQPIKHEERLRFIASENPSWDHLLNGGLSASGTRLPLDFPVALARDLIDEFCHGQGRVLDPCHGWGGRLLGFLLSEKGSSYVGFDPSHETFVGVRDLATDLARYCHTKHVETQELCFEDVKLGEQRFDLALTSPPYYDTEHYTGAGYAKLRYPTFEEWNNGFYRTMIASVAAVLEPGACFLLNVGNQRYPLVEQALLHAKTCGLHHEETRSADMPNNFAETPEEQGEQIVVLRNSS